MATQRYSVEVKSLGSIRGTFWYREGTSVLHRVGGPAMEYADGGKEWYVDGLRHRVDGPAIEWVSGHKEWYVDGQGHREDGPAIEWVDGRKHWWLNGQLHRVDGPAVEYADGTGVWYLNGKKVTQEKHAQMTAPPVEEMTMAQLEAVLGKRIKIIK